MDKLRKKETQRLKKELAKAEYEQRKGARGAVRKRSADLTEQDKEGLKGVLAAAPELNRASELREE